MINASTKLTEEQFAIDMGNSDIKLGLFHKDRLLRHWYNLEERQLLSIIGARPELSVIILSVRDMPSYINDMVEQGKAFLIDGNTPLPFTSMYQTPATLGMDRVAAVAGAQLLYPGENVLCIDAGTCITYDFLDSSGRYHGGAISPGLKMRFDAMHTFTARLPLVLPKSYDNIVLEGNSTENALSSGGFWGILSEIEGMILRFREKHDKLRVIICGGNTKFFESKIKAPIFVHPELVLVGLNTILRYNASIH